MSKCVELLAPAGSLEAFYAALNASCDAVYLGVQKFGARAYANNFDYDQLADIRRISALYGVKIYVTLNTLIKNDELEDCLATVDKLASIGVDAIIVADIGLAKAIHYRYPDMPLHASTQMAINSVAGVKLLKECGFSRVVLARECPMEIIEQACKQGVEIECFVHGALCIAMSGQCLISSFSGNRSGNRGRCAQACRQTYSLGGKKAAWLSARDIMLYNSLPQLINIGVTSFKIEGRMKRSDYVSSVVAQYRYGIDKALAKKFENIDKDDYKSLMQAFNRGDFSNAYAGDKRDIAIINPNRVNHGGILVGSVESLGKSLVYIKAIEAIEDQDMLVVRDDSTKLEVELTYSGKSAKKGEIACTYTKNINKIKRGMKVFRLISAAQQNIAKNRKRQPLPVLANVELIENKNTFASFSYNDISVCKYFDIVDSAKNKALDYDGVFKAFAKLNDTCFFLKSLNLETKNAFIPLSSLNAIRRELALMLENKILQTNIPKYILNNSKASAFKKVLHKGLKVLSCNIDVQNYIADEDIFIYKPSFSNKDILESELKKLRKDAYVMIHTSLRDKEAQLIADLCNSYGIAGVLLDNIGHFGLNLYGLNIAIGEGVPICNASALNFFNSYNIKFILSFSENSLDEQLNIYGKNIAYKVYGRQRLMLLNHCPARAKLGLSIGKDKCRLCFENKEKSLIGMHMDMENKSYPLKALYSLPCIVELYNYYITFTLPELKMSSYDNMFIDFVFEDISEQIDIYKAIKTKDISYFNKLNKQLGKAHITTPTI